MVVRWGHPCEMRISYLFSYGVVGGSLRFYSVRVLGNGFKGTGLRYGLRSTILPEVGLVSVCFVDVVRGRDDS